MDANPNNPVFLVHVFRVVELPSARISPKDWENHYKLDVMIGTIKPVVPLQAYQRQYDGESRILKAYQPLSSDYEEDQDEDRPVRVYPKDAVLPTNRFYSPRTWGVRVDPRLCGRGEDVLTRPRRRRSPRARVSADPRPYGRSWTHVMRPVGRADVVKHPRGCGFRGVQKLGFCV
jgi:hypothetical protein